MQRFGDADVVESAGSLIGRRSAISFQDAIPRSAATAFQSSPGRSLLVFSQHGAPPSGMRSGAVWAVRFLFWSAMASSSDRHGSPGGPAQKDEPAGLLVGVGWRRHLRSEQARHPDNV